MDTEDSTKICDSCDGSGEGLNDESICYTCGGFGEVYLETEEPDFDPDIDFDRDLDEAICWGGIEGY